jgi:hypothetical protein
MSFNEEPHQRNSKSNETGDQMYEFLKIGGHKLWKRK